MNFETFPRFCSIHPLRESIISEALFYQPSSCSRLLLSSATLIFKSNAFWTTWFPSVPNVTRSVSMKKRGKKWKIISAITPYWASLTACARTASRKWCNLLKNLISRKPITRIRNSQSPQCLLRHKVTKAHRHKVPKIIFAWSVIREVWSAKRDTKFMEGGRQVSTWKLKLQLRAEDPGWPR